ncbi:formyltetrahydrofolate deformylase [Candidatus Gottesmanbacteria bacterium RIFCSPLOWO2_01_FULL_39_12b]|uniref:Formyltetrahydrofolate deformylase n=1 Tax=Candidatus Gottesmanbacteria bacterium RIFCSPLOWO2_01_FULL_39_12b TaxID=1798388 RepID=A0A1F6ANG5_9BACT|nr:MAG: formyltetrahydrofolate deformylase [Candidatus Gottesmanbacteria bacterium RIFCSPLOWO2_01_FULL_39_12b]
MKNTATLLISCPDRKGIVATVANFLYRNGGNILHADQHLDRNLGLFFTRIEWDMTDFKLTKKDIVKKFTPTARDFKMEWRLEYSNYLPKVAILVSKEEHCLSDLLSRYKNREISCLIPFVFSNHSNVKDLVEFYGIKFPHMPINGSNRKSVEEFILKLLDKDSIDLVVLAKYMQILSPDFIHRYKNRIINIHHSFLPSFIGAKPYHQAYQRGVKIIGATSHYVTEELDNGPIIEQDIIRISHRDTVERLISKGKDLEKIVLSRAVRWHLENRILIYGNKTVVFD